MSRPAFFLDRDGVVNEDPDPEPYVLSWAQWRWSAGIQELLQEIKRQEYLTILVTSQKGVGKGLMSLKDLEGIHARMQKDLGDLAFDGIQAYTGLADCPLAPKPNPQMIESAVETWDIDLSRSWLLGDADRDLEMGRAAGVGQLVRLAGLKPVNECGDHLVRNLSEVVKLLRNESLSGSGD